MRDSNHHTNKFIDGFLFIDPNSRNAAARYSPLCGLTVEALQAGMRALAECRADGWEDALTVHEVYYRIRESLDAAADRA